MMVVTNHLWGDVFGGIFKFNGGLGVDIFFVLSGFLMVYTQNDKRGPYKFLLGRIKRIYPLYIIISTPIILMLVNLDGVYKLISNLLLFPTFGKYHHGLANSPSWTLIYEMVFYVFFTFSLLISKNSRSACLISVGIIISSILITHNVIGMEPRYGWIHLGYILGDTLMLDFAAGTLLALIYKKIGKPKFIKFNLMLIIVLSIIYISLCHIDGARLYRFGVPALLIISIAIYTKEGNGILYKTLHVIGDASYSIYLSHIYFFYVVRTSLIANKESIIASQVSVIMTTLVCVCVGIFINRTIEKPLLSYLNGRKSVRL